MTKTFNALINKLWGLFVIGCKRHCDIFRIIIANGVWQSDTKIASQARNDGESSGLLRKLAMTERRFAMTVGIIALLLINNVLYTHAQSYSSVKMEELGGEIPADCLPSTNSIFNCPTILKNKSLVVNYNQTHDISHLGISLFSDETKELLNLQVCNFIERMMLELVLETSTENLMHKLDRLKLSITKNGLPYGDARFTSITNVLDELQLPAQFSIMREDDKFAAVWKYNQDDQFVFSFPASRELIFGTDKKESDDLLNRMLFGSGRLCNETNSASAGVATEANMSFDREKNIYTSKGVEFMMAAINSNTYYQKKGNAFELLFEKDFPAESFTNLVMNNMGNLNHKLHVTHRMYGNFSPDFDISLKEFLCYFQSDFNIYAAAFPDSKDTKQMKLTVILRNMEYNYLHLLVITAPVNNIFSQDGLLTAEFYSNIPQQSIRNLVGDMGK